MSQTPNQRFLKRLWLLDNLPLLLRDAIYHRAYEEEEKLPGVVLWKTDDEEPRRIPVT